MNKLPPEAEKHFKQAIHNYTFFCEVHSKLPKAFYDWKATVLFYTSIHLLRALLKQRDVEVKDNHHALRKAINPNNPNSNSPVKKHCYNSYLVLYNASLDTRYTGFLDSEKRKDYLKSKFKKCQKAIKSIDSYMKSQGYNSLMSIQREFDFKDSE